MKIDLEDFSQNRDQQFVRLGLWYILALGAIASIILIGQFLIQNHLTKQLTDSHVVNVAGRQRMLSQKIAKQVLYLRNMNSTDTSYTHSLARDLLIWQQSHLGLIHGDTSMHLPGKNSGTISAMFSEIQPSFDSILLHAEAIIGIMDIQGATVNTDMAHRVDIILRHESRFLEGMDKIVNQYDDEAQVKVRYLSNMEYGLLSLALLIIILEFLLIFRPTAACVNETVSKLSKSEKSANIMAKEIAAIYNSLEKSYEQLAKVIEPDDMPKLWARADRGGNLIMVAEAYHRLSGVAYKNRLRISDLFFTPDAGNDFMDNIVEATTEGNGWSGELMFKRHEHETWVSVTICPVLSPTGQVGEVLVFGSDISNRKRAEQDIHHKNRNEVEKKINQQKHRSSLILEGQEEERKRLAMDIHDGIGQLLTSLKFQLEAIDPARPEQNTHKLDEVKAVLNETIREVRRVTFNLKPTVLGDYGLAAGLKLFISEVAKYSNTEMVFHNADRIDDRFTQRIENSIFRIVQEAVNNAVKYAQASKIEVKLFMQDELLGVTITDNGIGFEPAKIKSNKTDSHSGFYNLYERSDYINGTLEIDSVLGKGTTVSLLVPVKQLNIT